MHAISPIATHFSAAWSVICHTHAPCLNRSTDLQAIWQVHLPGPMTHCVRWGPWSQKGKEKGKIWGEDKISLAYDSPGGSTVLSSDFDHLLTHFLLWKQSVLADPIDNCLICCTPPRKMQTIMLLHRYIYIGQNLNSILSHTVLQWLCRPAQPALGWAVSWYVGKSANSETRSWERMFLGANNSSAIPLSDNNRGKVIHTPQPVDVMPQFGGHVH